MLVNLLNIPITTIVDHDNCCQLIISLTQFRSLTDKCDQNGGHGRRGTQFPAEKRNEVNFMSFSYNAYKITTLVGKLIATPLL